MAKYAILWKDHNYKESFVIAKNKKAARKLANNDITKKYEPDRDWTIDTITKTKKGMLGKGESMLPFPNKEYSQKYYQDHKEKLKQCSRDYHKAHREDINIRKRNLGVIRVTKVLGVRLKEKKLEPFMQRISLELKAKMEENTKINNDKIKYYSMIETKDKYLVQNLMKMKETKAEN